MSFFRKLARGSSARQRHAPRGKADARAYAIGDIHGCLDLLDALLARIEEDSASRPPKRTWIVFLGDLIDRGPQSREVLEFVRDLQRRQPGRDWWHTRPGRCRRDGRTGRAGPPAALACSPGVPMVLSSSERTFFYRFVLVGVRVRSMACRTSTRVTAALNRRPASASVRMKPQLAVRN